MEESIEMNALAVNVDQYRDFHRDGFLIIENLISEEDVGALRSHADDIVQGRMPWQVRAMSRRDTAADSGTLCQPAARAPDGLSAQERQQYFVRMHMLHRTDPLHERMLLHPRVIDAVEALIGPDVLALSTMLFFKPPGKQGQGWHQDSFYLPVLPDTLCGVWIAIDDCDAENGALQIAAGSCVEPVYPPESGYGFGNGALAGLPRVRGAGDSGADGQLGAIAARYPLRTITMKAGSGVLFSGHVLHRSTANASPDRPRRSFAAHYCNARSFVRWGSDQVSSDVHAAPEYDKVTGMANASYILARGSTHLPFSLPIFGTRSQGVSEVAVKIRGELPDFEVR